MKNLVMTAVVCGIFSSHAVFAYNAPETSGSGPYSSAQAQTNAGAIDQGIAGFVGSDGEGACLGLGPNNYVNPIFKGWATTVVNYSPSDATTFYGMNGIGAAFADPAKALGTVTGDNFDIVSLGDRDTSEIANGVAPGTLTLSFASPISNGSGADFAVFENGFISAGGAGVAGQIFAELTYVEVSTDGVNFVRFPSVSQTSAQVGAYGTVDPTQVYNLAGKHVNAYGSSWGTPFDLDCLTNETLVKNGTVDLNNINYVRLVDIAGNGSQLDSNGNPIYDAWVTWGSGGADIEALGVIRHLGETQSASSGTGALGWGWNCAEGSLRLEYKGLLNAADFTTEAFTGEALSQLAAVGTVLNAWTVLADDALFSADGGIRLFAYFDSSAFGGDITELLLMQWDGATWQQIAIDSVDLNNFLLQSEWVGDISSFAIVQVPEPGTSVLLAGAGMMMLLRRRR